ncbi:hypothetical protein LY76DRAFT_592418, partial [Colletotrichum caudatum]
MANHLSSAGPDPPASTQKVHCAFLLWRRRRLRAAFAPSSGRLAALIRICTSLAASHLSFLFSSPPQHSLSKGISPGYTLTFPSL